MDERRKTAENAARGNAAPNAQRRPARAELIWDGKYDAAGRRVAPLRVALPFQTVETVNESAQDRQRSLRYGPGFGEEEWRNLLIWGDKKYVLPSLLAEFAGKVNLIYIDPPFDTGADFSFTATVPDDPETLGGDSFRFTKEPSIIEQKAYRDTWGRGLDSYLQWFYETAILLHELLYENGSLYVHLDWHVSHAAKCVLDEVFGPEKCQNEIVWKRTTAHSDSQTYSHVHDVILFYTKTEDFVWNPQYTEHDEQYLEDKYTYVDEKGRRYMLDNITSPNPRPNMMYVWKGFPPPEKGWRYSKETMARLDAEGRIWYPNDNSKRPRLKRYLDETKGRLLDSVWTDVNPVNSQASERLNYRTQKPEALLERIIEASSNEEDLVLDCVCGSGTTAAVAEKLGRRWIACDLGRFAIHTTRKRLLSIPKVRPFVVQNLGKYERQLWAGAEFGQSNGGKAAERQRAYIEFVLKLTQAIPLHGYAWLHGVKAGCMVHVGAVDAPVSVGDVAQIAAEFRRAVGTGKDAPKTNGVDVLGWDFAFELNEVARQQAAAANIQMRFLRIPRDVMDKRAVEQGDIHFFELAALSVEVITNRRNVALKLKDFVIPPDDVPEEARRAVKHWSQWIDYWAVDWDNRGDTFHNEWQTYRTRKDKSLALEITHTYPDPGEYAIVAKVIDILGNVIQLRP
ncbi:MAG TPA: site-specific DNA-methyltransferase [Candidatus Binataceae bacterium]|nr:site-specific DNA-methyltransferase [Candidatus Binataceae bacterium]